MRKILFILLLLTVTGFANTHSLIGNWYASSRTLHNNSETIERETFSLKSDKRFSIVLLVSVKNGDAYIKDLRIEVYGSWESKGNALILVIKTLRVPSAKDVYLVSQSSLETLAANFKAKYESDKIYILKIKALNKKQLVTETTKGTITKYKR